MSRACAQFGRRIATGFFALHFLLRPAAAAEDEPPGRIEFEGRNLLRRVHHVFRRWDFTRVELDPARPQAARVELEIDLSSADTGSEEMNRRLRSREFLDVERFPTATLSFADFEPAPPAPDGRPRYVATMKIDLHGVERSMAVLFDLSNLSPLEVEGAVTLNRSAFGIGKPCVSLNPLSIRDRILVRVDARVPVSLTPAGLAAGADPG